MPDEPSRDASPASASTVLQVEALTLSFGGVKALTNVGFGVAAGSITAVIGPNGAGKTSLFNTISGFYKPAQGRVLFEGEDITRLPAPKRARARAGAQLPEHCALPRHDGARQHQARPACAPEDRCVRRPLLPGPRAARRGRAAPRRGRTDHRLPRDRPHPPRLRGRPALRFAKARGNGARTGNAAQGADARRAGGRHEPRRDGRHGALHPRRAS